MANTFQIDRKLLCDREKNKNKIKRKISQNKKLGWKDGSHRGLQSNVDTVWDKIPVLTMEMKKAAKNEREKNDRGRQLA